MLKPLFLLLLLATIACSGPGIPEVVDGGPSTDATVRGRVAIHLGAAAAGKVVFSSKADGSLLFSTSADANGDAIVLTEPGGMVSVIALGATLTSFVGLEPDTEITWEHPAPQEAKIMQVSFEPYPEASLYTFSACEWTNYGFEGLNTVRLWLTDDCLQNRVVPIMGFAESFPEGLLAYSFAEVASEEVTIDTVALEWKTDFVESPIHFVAPDATAKLDVAGVYDYGSLRVSVPEEEVAVTNLRLRRPRGTVKRVWTEITNYSGLSGWQEQRGTLPTAKDQWINPVTNLALTHTETELSARWDATTQGDFVTGAYYWSTPTRNDSWQFFATHNETQVAFPDLPPEVPALPSLTVPPSSPLLVVSTVDYGDTETLQTALLDGSFTREFLDVHAHAYLAAGGRIARGENYVDQLPEGMSKQQAHDRINRRSLQPAGLHSATTSK